MKISSKAISWMAAALTLALPATQARAQTNWPEQPVRILVGFTPGVAPDITSRLFADKFSAAWASRSWSRT